MLAAADVINAVSSNCYNTWPSASDNTGVLADIVRRTVSASDAATVHAVAALVTELDLAQLCRAS